MYDDKVKLGIEVQDIFRQFAPAYLQAHRLPLQQLKVASAVSFCRTSKLGAHTDFCDECGHTQISYNSCRNRHCPKCQGLAKEQWLQDRRQDLLPVPYFHVVFTLPDLLNPLVLRNQKLAELAREDAFKVLLDQLYDKDWVVYCKPPFKSPHHVLEYLGRYTHQVAILNNRLIKLEEGKVTFQWRDYRDKSKQKLMTVECHEFIRRFLMHVLPYRFVKIRHFGILSNRNRRSKLLTCKKLTGASLSSSPKKLTAVELLLKLTGRDVTLCPCCQKGHMKRQTLLPLMAVP